jgi:hypothetical protein
VRINKSRTKVLGILLASTLVMQSNAVVFAASNDLPSLEMSPASLIAAANIASPSIPLSTNAPESLSTDAVSIPVPRDSQPQKLASDETLASASLPLGNTSDVKSSTLSATITSDPNEAMRRIDELTRQILLKEIELERYNLHYKLEVAKQGRWKGWRYGGFQIVNNTLGLSGGIVGVAERGSHIRTGKIHTSVQENSCTLAQVGSWIGAGAALIELGINEYHELEARKHGFSPHAAREKVNGLRSDIDTMLAERTALTAVEAGSSSLNAHSTVDAAEGKVLADLRDQGLLEFERFHITARKLLAFQQTQYFFDFAKYTLNGLGSEFAFLSLHKHHREWNGRAGVMYITAGGITMFGPIVSRYIAKGVGEAHRHYVKGSVKEAEGAEVATLEKDQVMLSQLVRSNTVAPDTVRAPLDRAALYSDQSKTFQDELASSSKTRDKAKLSATQNIGAGLYVGASKVAQGVLFANVGFNSNFYSQTTRAGLVTNYGLFAASVVSLQASAFSILDTLRINVQGEINRRKLVKSGMLPQQLIANRLAQLDAMEKRVRAIP